MLALKEFANFITLNTANLAIIFARLLAESSPDYAATPQNSRIAAGRKLLNAVSAACEQQTSAPLLQLFENHSLRWPESTAPNRPLVEIECLGQTLTPVVTNLEAGKFLWDMLFEARVRVAQPISAPAAPMVPLKIQPGEAGDSMLLNTVINNLPDHIYIKDAQSRFLLVNEAVCRHLGAASPAEAVGKTDFDYSPRELAEQYMADEVALFKTGQSIINLEQPIFDHETGTTRWVTSTKVLFTDTQGKVAGLVGVNRDITELRKVQQDLTRFKLGIECSHDAVFLTDINGKIIYVNPAFEQLYGFSPPEALGQTPRILKSGVQPQEYYQKLWSTLLSGKLVANEIINKTKTGQLVYVAGNNNPIVDEKGQIIGFLAIHHDVTDQKRAEESLVKRAAELETVARVSVAVSNILDVDELLQSVVDLTKERFGLYHAHIYLLNPIGDTLELVAGAGEIGRQMLRQGWQIPKNKEFSLVARTARTLAPVVVNDVLNSTGYFPNPLLPDTRAEMAVPIIAGDEFLGVLDVQSTVVSHFTADDERVQLALASQVAVALRNARLYAQTRAALAEVQQSQQLLRTVVDATPDWIFIKDRNHHYQLVNQSYANTLSLTVEDMLDKTDLDVGFPEDIVKGNPEKGIRGFWADDTEVMDSGQTKIINVEPGVVHGQPVFLGTVKVPLFDDKGQVWGVLGYVRDITEREQMLAETRRRADETALIQTVTSALNTTGSLADNLPLLVNQLRRMMPVDILLLAEHQPHDPEITLFSSGIKLRTGYFARQEARLPVDGTCVGWVIAHNEVWQEADMRGAKQFLEDDLLAAEGVAARLVLPIMLGATVIGALYLGSSQPGAYTEAHLPLLWQITDQLASAIERNRLFEETQRRVRREQTLREITEKLRRAPDMETLLQVGVTELSKVLVTDRAFVRLGLEAELAQPADPVTSPEPEPAATPAPPPVSTNGRGDKQL